MPEHTHVLVLPVGSASRVSRLLARIQQPISKQTRLLLQANDSPLVRQRTVQERPGKLCFRFWQEGPVFDRTLFSPAEIAASSDCIHTNPVKRGLCKTGSGFRWPNFRFHLQGLIDPDLLLLWKPDPAWFHLSGVRFDQKLHWRSQWHTARGTQAVAIRSHTGKASGTHSEAHSQWQRRMTRQCHSRRVLSHAVRGVL